MLMDHLADEVEQQAEAEGATSSRTSREAFDHSKAPESIRGLPYYPDQVPGGGID